MVGAHRTTNRLLLGGIAGIAGTVAMTAAMRALHRYLPAPERYPLPPREIVQGVVVDTAKGAPPEPYRQETTLAAHFGYGAATGAGYAFIRPSDGVVAGALYGVLVWAGSYLTLMPGLGILTPAVRHPLRRNLLMIAVHLVWGGTMALTLRELERAQTQVFAGDAAPDRHGDGSESVERPRESHGKPVQTGT